MVGKEENLNCNNTAVLHENGRLSELIGQPPDALDGLVYMGFRVRTRAIPVFMIIHFIIYMEKNGMPAVIISTLTIRL